MEKLSENKETRKLFIEVNTIKKGFQPRTNYCKDKDGNLIGNLDGILDCWAEQFEELLNISLEEDKPEDEEEEVVFHGPEMEMEMPMYAEVKTATDTLKRNKAPGEDRIMVVLLQKGGPTIWRIIYELITEIWRQKQMPKEWKCGVICPILKKGDKTVCNNYRGISLLCTTYKVMARILAKRLEPYAVEIIGEYQCGFRRNRATTDQIF
jgi:hypothetical protein